MGGGLNFNCCCCDSDCLQIFGGNFAPIKVIAPTGTWQAGTYSTFGGGTDPFGNPTVPCDWWYGTYDTTNHTAHNDIIYGAWQVSITSAGTGDSTVWTVTVNFWEVCTGIDAFGPLVVHSWAKTFDCKLPTTSFTIDDGSGNIITVSPP